MSEIRKMLVVRGVLDPDELKALGLPMAHRYAEADSVVLIGDDGQGLVMKGAGGDAWLVQFFDIIAPSGTLAGDGQGASEAGQDEQDGQDGQDLGVGDGEDPAPHRAHEADPLPDG